MTDLPYARRATDSKRHDIEAMIAEENDPKQRAFLIILNSINVALMANTSATAGLSQKFDDHLTTFEEKVAADAEILNQGKGMWKVIAWGLGAAQAVVVALAVYAANDLDAIHKAIQAGHDEDIRMELRIKNLEEKK
ncbi:MAG: hypothetical protein CGW95_04730 [Phenylobacterium zucineum]|nr:MAG: hypothetical protein CGW95_04730 [Phenylobacterium zucineum]